MLGLAVSLSLAGVRAGAENKEAEAGTTEEHSPPWLVSLLPYTAQDRLLRDCTTHSTLGPLTPTINQENAPDTHPRPP